MHILLILAQLCTDRIRLILFETVDLISISTMWGTRSGLQLISDYGITTPSRSNCLCSACEPDPFMPRRECPSNCMCDECNMVEPDLSDCCFFCRKGLIDWDNFFHQMDYQDPVFTHTDGTLWLWCCRCNAYAHPTCAFPDPYMDEEFIMNIIRLYFELDGYRYQCYKCTNHPY